MESGRISTPANCWAKPREPRRGWDHCCVLSTAPSFLIRWVLSPSPCLYHSEVDCSQTGHGFEGHLSFFGHGGSGQCVPPNSCPRIHLTLRAPSNYTHTHTTHAWAAVGNNCFHQSPVPRQWSVYYWENNDNVHILYIFKHIEMEQRQGQVFRWKTWASKIVRIKSAVQVRNVFSSLPYVASPCVIAIINGQQSDEDNRVPSLSPTVLSVMRHIAAVNSCLGVKCSTPGDLSVTTMTSAVNGHQFKRTWWGGDSSQQGQILFKTAPHIAIIDMNYPLCNPSRIFFSL